VLQILDEKKQRKQTQTYPTFEVRQDILGEVTYRWKGCKSFRNKSIKSFYKKCHV